MACGDHIKVTRNKGLYTHHGIDMGDGTVIHFTGTPFQSRSARVVRSTLAEFLGNGGCRVVRHTGPVQAPEVVAQTAESLLQSGDYCMLRNNCEHFANYCKTGVNRSRQVRRLAFLGGATASVVTLVGMTFARRVARQLWVNGSQ